MGYYTRIEAIDTKTGEVIADCLDIKLFGYCDDEDLYEALGFIAVNCERPVDLRYINTQYACSGVLAFLSNLKKIEIFLNILCKHDVISEDRYKKDFKDFSEKVNKYKIDHNVRNVQFDLIMY